MRVCVAPRAWSAFCNCDNYWWVLCQFAQSSSSERIRRKPHTESPILTDISQYELIWNKRSNWISRITSTHKLLDESTVLLTADNMHEVYCTSACAMVAALFCWLSSPFACWYKQYVSRLTVMHGRTRSTDVYYLSFFSCLEQKLWQSTWISMSICVKLCAA